MQSFGHCKTCTLPKSASSEKIDDQKDFVIFVKIVFSCLKRVAVAVLVHAIYYILYIYTICGFLRYWCNVNLRRII